MRKKIFDVCDASRSGNQFQQCVRTSYSDGRAVFASANSKKLNITRIRQIIF